MSQDKPNIILITADQLRHDAIGCADGLPVRTPHIDALAARGTRFTDAITPCPLCVPARASIMTGQPSYEHGVYYNDQPWPRQTQTLPRALAEMGYDTAVLGKTHFMLPIEQTGFDRHLPPPEGSEAHKNMRTPPGENPNVWAHRTRPLAATLENYGSVALTDLMLAELDRREQRPFFYWLSYREPHSPCVPPEPYASMYDPDDVPRPIDEHGQPDHYSAPVRRWFDAWQALTADQRHRFRCNYLGEVTLLDEQIGRVLDYVRDAGLADNTLIVFSADHGDYLGDHGMLQKGFFHEPSVNVPLIFAGPNVPVGEVTNAPANLIDLMPTILDYCGRPTSTSAEARSLMSVFDGDASRDRIQLSETGIHGQGVMLRSGRRKYNLYVDSGELEYFDLDSDPDELRNHRGSIVRSDLPEPVAKKLDSVLAATEAYRGRTYHFNGKDRPMFT